MRFRDLNCIRPSSVARSTHPRTPAVTSLLWRGADTVAPCLAGKSPRVSFLRSPALSAKKYRFALAPNHSYKPRRPVPQRGARDRHGRWERDAMDAKARSTMRSFSRTAKSCGSDASTLAFKLVEAIPPATVTIEPDHRGDHVISRNTIARGMPDESGVTVVTTLVCFLFLHARLRRVERPVFPAPSEFQMASRLAKLARSARRECRDVCELSATSLRRAKATKQSILDIVKPSVDCFACARNDTSALIFSVMAGQKREARLRARCPGHPRLSRGQQS